MKNKTTKRKNKSTKKLVKRRADGRKERNDALEDVGENKVGIQKGNWLSWKRIGQRKVNECKRGREQIGENRRQNMIEKENAEWMKRQGKVKKDSKSRKWKGSRERKGPKT